MLLRNDPDKTVLSTVEPKNRIAVKSNQRVGWTLTHRKTTDTVLDGFNLPAIPLMEVEPNGPCNESLLIAHSMDQRTVIMAAKARSKAILGTSA